MDTVSTDPHTGVCNAISRYKLVSINDRNENYIRQFLLRNIDLDMYITEVEMSRLNFYRISNLESGIGEQIYLLLLMQYALGFTIFFLYIFLPDESVHSFFCCGIRVSICNPIFFNKS